MPSMLGIHAWTEKEAIEDQRSAGCRHSIYIMLIVDSYELCKGFDSVIGEIFSYISRYWL